MNPDRVQMAQAGQADRIRTTLDLDMRVEMAMPPLLWNVIDATPTWFAVNRGLASVEAKS